MAASGSPPRRRGRLPDATNLGRISGSPPRRRGRLVIDVVDGKEIRLTPA